MISEISSRFSVVRAKRNPLLLAVQALQVLGYPVKSAQRAVQKACEAEPGASVEAVIRAALKII